MGTHPLAEAPIVPMGSQMAQFSSHGGSPFPHTTGTDVDGNTSQANLQYWLSQADSEVDADSLMRSDINASLHRRQQPTNPSSISAAGPSNVHSSHIPNAMSDASIAKLEGVWRAKIAKSQYFEDLWNQVAGNSATNIFCCDNTLAPLAHTNGHTINRRGVDNSVRNQLKAEFGTPFPMSKVHVATESASSSQTDKFPPAEVLDISLDIYFRQIHPKNPFIHVPTFKAASTPPSLLFIMCILGLSTMSTTGDSRFVKKAFLDVRRRALMELVATDTIGNTSEEHLCAFATSFLALQLAVFSSDIDLVAQTQVLYSTLMAVSTRQGLYNAPEAACSDMLPPPDQLTQRWHAWARVESIRRLISCLVGIDWWWGNNACLNPTIRPENIHMSLPSDDDLFNAQTAEEWMHLIQMGRNIEMPSIKPQSFHLKGSLDPVFMQPHPLQGFTLLSLLSVVKHILCDTQHRYFAQIEDWRGADKLVPWKTYRMDFRGCSFVPTVVQLGPLVTKPGRYSDVNVVVQWHNLNINLTANVNNFEVAAGRRGRVKALEALADIAEWSKTPAARRAAIHAAHIYRSLNNRKAAENLMLNSYSSLFSSALVIGLFVLHAPSYQNAGSGPGLAAYDLIGDIDWGLVGDCGLTDPVTKPVSMYDAHQRTAATDFINFGGPVLLNGVPNSGSASARRVLHDFAHLMDGMGAWKPKTFSQILHIMSEELVEMT